MDPYSILGVSRTASQEEIKKAYRRLAMEFHPDRNESPDAEEEFKKVSEAHSLIGTPSARERYEASQRAAPHSFDDFFTGGNPGASWDDLFGAFRSSRYSRPFVIKSHIVLTLEEIYNGSMKTFSLDNQVVSFPVPKTTRPGEVLRVKMESSQELHMTVSMAQHPIFTLSGDDLHTVIDVPVRTALIGGIVKAPTLGSNINLTIPPNTCSHSKLRARNSGLHTSRMSRGSIVYEVKINTKNVSPSLTEFLKR